MRPITSAIEDSLKGLHEYIRKDVSWQQKNNLNAAIIKTITTAIKTQATMDSKIKFKARRKINLPHAKMQSHVSFETKKVNTQID
jgi:hypothetical protein